MSNAIELARDRIMVPAGLDNRDLDRILARLAAHHLDGGDIYFQSRRSESWSLEDGVVREGARGIVQGAGVRAISGERIGFAHSDEVAMPALLEAASAARSIARSGTGACRLAPFRHRALVPRYDQDDPLSSLSANQKVALLEAVDGAARAVDPRVRQVMVSLVASHEIVLVAATDGTLAADHRPLVRISVRVVAEQDGRREQGSAGGGGRHALGALLLQERALEYGREAACQALINLQAEDAPAGTMTVVLGPGWPGVLLHEAVGHGLEGDFNRKGTSAFAGRVGERVATPHCTVVDDGTLPERRGSLSMDDEGTPSQCTVLIERGVLRGYLQDKHNARLMGVASTGNGRRESFAHLPLPRMTNTYMLAGAHEPGEIIASVAKGLYAVNFGGGQVDITSGRFVFSASEAYLIENGRVTCPVKGATLIGNGPQVLTRVSMVGNDLALDAGIGVCGKEGQSVPVGVGQPTLRVDALTVGGTRA